MPLHANQSKPKHTYLLNGLAVCDVCARRLRVQRGNTVSYYREVSNQRGFADCPSAGRSTRQTSVDEQVDAIFRLLRLPPDW